MAQSSVPSPDTSPPGQVTDAQYELLSVAYSTSRVVGSPGDADLVFGDASGRNVKVRANRTAYIRGRLWQSGPSALSLTLTANSGATRIDLIVLGMDRTTWDATVYVKTGTPGAGAPPALAQDSGSTTVFEIPLAKVTCVNGFSTVNSGDVSNLAWYLGYPPLLCRSGNRPAISAGLMFAEADTGDWYVEAQGRLEKVYTTAESTLMPNGLFWTGRGQPYANSSARAQVCFLNVDCVAGHSYEIRARCKVFSGNGSAQMPITTHIELTDGATLLDFDDCTLTLTDRWDTAEVVHVFVATTTGTHQFQLYASRLSGGTGATFDVYADPGAPLYFRAYDLGRTPGLLA